MLSDGVKAYFAFLPCFFCAAFQMAYADKTITGFSRYIDSMVVSTSKKTIKVTITLRQGVAYDSITQFRREPTEQDISRLKVYDTAVEFLTRKTETVFIPSNHQQHLMPEHLRNVARLTDTYIQQDVMDQWQLEKLYTDALASDNLANIVMIRANIQEGMWEHQSVFMDMYSSYHDDILEHVGIIAPVSASNPYVGHPNAQLVYEFSRDGYGYERLVDDLKLLLPESDYHLFDRSSGEG